MSGPISSRARRFDFAPGYVPSSERKRRPLLALAPMSIQPEVYFDDTGCNREHAKVFMWAGYVSQIRNWNRFSDAWRAILSAPPSLEYWHMAEARAKKRKAPFDALSDKQIRKKEEALARLLSEQKTIASISIRIPFRYYDQVVLGSMERIFGGTKRERKVTRVAALESPHYIGLQFATVLALQIASTWGDILPVNFFYESRDNDPYQENALNAWKTLSAEFRPGGKAIVGQLAFVPGKTGSAPPLQAADMLAWHLGQRALRPGVDDHNWRHVSRIPINEHALSIRDLEYYVGQWKAIKRRKRTV